jgi:uncharacterized damage-inducible protein DinB
MPNPTYYTTMATYNHWMNQNLYALCAEIPDELRKADRGAFFKSIHGTLNHLLYGDRAWLGRFVGQPYYRKMGEDLYADFAELRLQREITDREILEWAETLSPEWLSQPFTYHSNVYGKTRILPTWLLVTHMFNHQTHHRGQLTTLLSQMGYDPGITDLPWMPSLDAVAEDSPLQKT